MGFAARVEIQPHDVTFDINRGRDCENGSRYIDGCKRIVAQEKTMSVAVAVKIGTNDVASVVDRIGNRKNGSRHVDLPEGRLTRLPGCFQFSRKREAGKRQQDCSECNT